jgi:hypothetical protein
MSGRRYEHRGKHEPLLITIRRPRARVALTRSDGELIMAALADAAGYRELRANQWCEKCMTAPEGACDEHLDDMARAAAYGDLSAQLADVLPAPEGEAGP